MEILISYSKLCSLNSYIYHMSDNEKEYDIHSKENVKTLLMETEISISLITNFVKYVLFKFSSQEKREIWIVKHNRRGNGEKQKKKKYKLNSGYERV